MVVEAVTTCAEIVDFASLLGKSAPLPLRGPRRAKLALEVGGGVPQAWAQGSDAAFKTRILP
jgi:hypothetical protein